MKLLIYHNPEKGTPGDCSLQTLTSAVGKCSQHTSEEKKWELSWNLDEAEGHIKRKPRIALPGT